jgi:mRNA interferase MazF
MKEGDVVLTPLPQADGKIKNRPAVVLRVMPQYGDLLVCGVSTQVHQEVVGFDETIRPSDLAILTSSGAVAGGNVRGVRNGRSGLQDRVAVPGQSRQ